MFFNFRKKKVLGLTIISQDSDIRGKICFHGVTRIAGSVVGDVISEGVLIIEETGEIRGNITADELICSGKVDGFVKASIRAEFSKSSSFSGEIYCPKLTIDESTSFCGRSFVCEPNTINARDANKDSSSDNRKQAKFIPCSNSKVSNIQLR